MPFKPLQRFNSLMGAAPRDNYGGLLSPADQRAATQAFRAQLASGLLSAAGPQRMPVSLGQAIGGSLPQAMQARDYRAETGIRNDQLRRQIDAENKQTASRAKLTGLFRGMGGEDGEFVAAVADVDPGLALGLLSGRSQQERTPTAVQTLIDAGIDPQSPQGQEILIKNLTGGDDSAMDRFAELQAQLELARTQREEKAAADAEVREREAKHIAITRALDQTEQIVNLGKELEGTALQLGMPMSTLRRATVSTIAGLGAALGFDVEAQKQAVTALDKYKKNAADQLINVMASGKLGAGTNDKLAQFKDSLASPDITFGAVQSIEANIAEALLDDAKLYDVPLTGRDRHESNIKAWRSYDKEPSASEQVHRPADIGRYSLEKIRSLDIDSLSDEQVDAVSRRLDELGQ
jgi:hypothetical protein